MHKLYTKFDLVYSRFLKDYLKKADDATKKSTHIFECNFSPINPIYYFSKYVSNIIVEDYSIFPVPKKLLDSIENFVLSSKIDKNDFIEQRYDFKDILNYVEDWDYYSEFKINMELLLKEKSNCSIICCAFDSREGAKKILSKYPIENTSVDDISNSFAFIYAYNEDDGFNACLTINANGNEHKIRKVVQHELIHWMQVSLNSHAHKSYGIFNDRKFNLTDSQYDKLVKIIGVDEITFKNDFEYLFNGKEFEAWTANTCEEFEDLGISLDEFKEIVEDEIKFIDKFIESDIYKREMWLFGRLCYLTSQNDSSDDRWWYLLEALKENVEQNEKLK